MDAYILALLGGGILILLVAWFPAVSRELPLSLPIVCVAIGIVVFSFPGPQGAIEPLRYPEIVERVTEFVVIVALTGAGLRLDRKLGFRAWRVTWRLLAVTMVLSIGLIAFLGVYGLGLSLATAMLLGAVLAPTDPVLAADVQTGPPRSGEDGEVRFALTSEAGLNDALAFPFVHLALTIAAAGEVVTAASLGQWALIAVLWKLGVAVAVGWMLGKALGWITFHTPGKANLSRTGDGLLALGFTIISYAATEVVQGYGFLAVFLTALGIRNANPGHEFNNSLHDFIEQIERLVMMAVLVMFGASIANGLFAALTWLDAMIGLVILLVVRPLAGWLGLLGLDQPLQEKAMIAFFGIRGLGSMYYLAYGLNHGEFEDADELWPIVGFIIAGSILIHGVTVTPLMKRIDKIAGQR